MKVPLVLSVAVVAAVAAVAVPAPSSTDTFRYHELVGIPRAAAIKTAEESGVATAAGRIFNGAPAALGQFPFFGGLLVTLDSGSLSSSGSSLISSTKLLTAAHCWTDRWNTGVSVTVVLGSLTLFFGGTRIVTSDVVVHEGWLSGWDLRDDIAVITIPPVAISSIIQPIALASGPETFAGQTATAIGVGMTSNTAVVGPHTFLAFVNLPVISNEVCSAVYPGFVHDTNVCTSGANGGNTCVGDSGGPVVVGNTLIGLVSYGSYVGCEGLQPGGHSRISAYYDWIVSHL